jgi:hypothetical protein
MTACITSVEAAKLMTAYRDAIAALATCEIIAGRTVAGSGSA